MDEKEKAQARLDAIEVGRLAGRLEAESRKEDPDRADERIRRAMAYAAWNFDGKQDDPGHAAEFGITNTVTPSLERAPLDKKASKEEKDNGKPKKKFGR